MPARTNLRQAVASPMRSRLADDERRTSLIVSGALGMLFLLSLVLSALTFPLHESFH